MKRILADEVTISRREYEYLIEAQRKERGELLEKLYNAGLVPKGHNAKFMTLETLRVLWEIYQ